jgi:hypothetical protein
MVDETPAIEVDPEEPEAAEPDLEVILPVTEVVTVNGIECRVRRIQTRELLSLLRLVSLSVGTNMSQLRFNLADPADAAQEVAALMLLCASMSQGETLVFLSTVVDPVDQAQRPKLAEYLQDNPDPKDTLVVLEQLAVQEAPDLVSLAGKVQAMVSRLAKLYQPPPERKSQRGGGGRSRARST